MKSKKNKKVKVKYQLTSFELLCTELTLTGKYSMLVRLGVNLP